MSKEPFDVVILTQDSYAKTPELNWYNLQVMLEDELVIDALNKVGLKAVKKSWSDNSFDWDSAHISIFRTTWDYFERFEHFKNWLHQTACKTNLLNAPETILWNIDKHYLLDLQSRQVNCVKTIILKQNDPFDLEKLIEDTGWKRIIIKPTVSAAAKDTYLIDLTNISDIHDTIKRLIHRQDMMVQPFQHNIQTKGEISLIVIDGKVSHAVRKCAKSGDFRVQDDHGGTVHPYEPTPSEIEFAEFAITQSQQNPLYARVDIIEDNDGNLALMELELIEPELFFRFCQPAAFKLAQAVKKRLTIAS